MSKAGIPVFRRIAVLMLGGWVLFSTPDAASAIDVQEVTSQQGIQALLVEDHSNPIIALRLAFRGGAGLDPAGKAGLANMVSGLIDEGAGDLDSQAFQGRLEDLSITLSFSASHDNFRGSLTTLRENRGAAFNLLKIALLHPRFDPEPIDRIRNQILAGIRTQSQDPDSIAGKTLFKTIFGEHPYARPRQGTEETVAAIGVNDLKAFTKSRLGKDNLVVGVVGAITKDELSAALDTVFGDLPEQASPWALPEIRPTLDGGVHFTGLNVAQSSILFVQEGLRRSDPDYYAAYVLNYILGGGTFVSRLYTEVREKRGLAYSVYSYLSPYDVTALYLGGAGTAAERVQETLDVVQDEWRRLRDRGVTQQELDGAKTYLTGSYPLRFSSSGAIANMLVGIQLSDLGSDYFNIRNDLINQVTLDDVNRLARTLISPDSLTFVVVGKNTSAPTE